MSGELPPGFSLDQAAEPAGLPAGFTLDQPQPSLLRRAMELSPAHFLATKVMPKVEETAQRVGGAVTDTLASGSSPRFPISPEIAAGAGTLAQLATGQVPYMGIGGVGGLAARQPLRAGAETLMQQALKPSIKALKNEGATGVNSGRAINTMLDEGINISKGGVEKLQGHIDALSASITDAIKGSGATVDTHAVAARLQDVIKGIESSSLHPQERVAAVEKIYNDVLANPALARNISVEKANQIKQGIYSMLKKEYGKLSGDSVTADKALAMGLKEEIAGAVPGVAQMSKKESELLNALELAKHRALMTGNKDVGGIGWLIENPLRFAAFMADRSPMFKSAISRLVNQTSKNAPALGVAGGAAYQENK